MVGEGVVLGGLTVLERHEAVLDGGEVYGFTWLYGFHTLERFQTGGQVAEVVLKARSAVFQGSEVIAGYTVVLEVRYAHTQRGQIGGEFLDGVLQGDEQLGVGGQDHFTGSNLLEQALNHHSRLIAGQVLTAPESTIGKTDDDATRHQFVYRVFGPMACGNVGDGWSHRLGRSCVLGQRAK